MAMLFKLSLIIVCHILVYTQAFTKPNILLVVADDLGFNDVGYQAVYHHSAMKTPHLDSLANSGVRLENYYVQPICTPSRSQLLSGRYQIHTGLQYDIIHPMQPNGLPLDNILLPEQLKKCGYDTHMVGKWHLGFYKKAYLPINRGFDSFYGFLGGSEDHYTKHKCVKLKNYDPFCGYDMYNNRAPTNSSYGEYSAFTFVKQAKLSINKSQKSGKPLFLYLSLQVVHAPLQVPSFYTKPFKMIKDLKRHNYAGMIAVMDEAVKNVTDHLKNIGMWNNTILIFTTDNGGQTLYGGNNWPLRGNKGTLWEGGIHGIGFVYSKLLDLVKHAGKVNNALMHISDWYPTVLSAAQCPLLSNTQKLDGFDQWNVITGKVKSNRSEILHAITPHFKPVKDEKIIECFQFQNLRMGFDTRVRAGIRFGEWKLLTGREDFNDWVKPPEWHNQAVTNKQDKLFNIFNCSSPSIRLYNIADDPYERNEVSNLYPKMVDQLLAKLVKYNRTAVPVRYPPNDLKADPKLHGGFWGPWM